LVFSVYEPGAGVVRDRPERIRPPHLSVTPSTLLLGDQVTFKGTGKFTRHFAPRKGKIGTGTWRVVARLRCESGEDGSMNFITRKRKLRVVK
jgi:hypothetical protein